MSSSFDKSQVKKFIRAVLTSSQQVFVIRSLSADFEDKTGEEIPYKELGYSTLLEFLLDIPDTVKVHNPNDRNSIVSVVLDEDTKHVGEMVANQKCNPKTSRFTPGRNKGYCNSTKFGSPYKSNDSHSYRSAVSHNWIRNMSRPGQNDGKAREENQTRPHGFSTPATNRDQPYDSRTFIASNRVQSNTGRPSEDRFGGQCNNWRMEEVENRNCGGGQYINPRESSNGQYQSVPIPSLMDINIPRSNISKRLICQPENHQIEVNTSREKLNLSELNSRVPVMVASNSSERNSAESIESMNDKYFHDVHDWVRRVSLDCIPLNSFSGNTNSVRNVFSEQQADVYRVVTANEDSTYAMNYDGNSTNCNSSIITNSSNETVTPLVPNDELLVNLDDFGYTSKTTNNQLFGNLDDYPVANNSVLDDSDDHESNDSVENTSICSSKIPESCTDSFVTATGTHPSNTVDDYELKDETVHERILSLVKKHPEGIWSTDLVDLYQDTYKEKFESLDAVITEYLTKAQNYFMTSFVTEGDNWMLFPLEINQIVQHKVVTAEIKNNVKDMMSRLPCGVYPEKLSETYQQYFGCPLNYWEYSYCNLEDFIAENFAEFMVLRNVGTKVWYVSPNLQMKYAYESPETTDGSCGNSERDMLNIARRFISDDVWPPLRAIPQQEVSLGEQKEIAVLVEEIYTPKWFYLRLIETDDEYKDLCNCLNATYNSYDIKRYKMHKVFIEVGAICACMFHQDCRWYRAQVTKIGDLTIEVFLFDVGSIAKIAPDEVYFLLKKYAQLPAQAFRATLFRVKLNANETRWDNPILNVVDKFSRTVNGVPLVAKVAEKIGNTLMVELFFLEHSTERSDKTVEKGESLSNSMHKLKLARKTKSEDFANEKERILRRVEQERMKTEAIAARYARIMQEWPMLPGSTSSEAANVKPLAWELGAANNVQVTSSVITSKAKRRKKNDNDSDNQESAGKSVPSVNLPVDVGESYAKKCIAEAVSKLEKTASKVDTNPKSTLQKQSNVKDSSTRASNKSKKSTKIATKERVTESHSASSNVVLNVPKPPKGDNVDRSALVTSQRSEASDRNAKSSNKSLKSLKSAGLAHVTENNVPSFADIGKIPKSTNVKKISGSALLSQPAAQSAGKEKDNSKTHLTNKAKKGIEEVVKDGQTGNPRSETSLESSTLITIENINGSASSTQPISIPITQYPESEANKPRASLSPLDKATEIINEVERKVLNACGERARDAQLSQDLTPLQENSKIAGAAYKGIVTKGPPPGFEHVTPIPGFQLGLHVNGMERQVNEIYSCESECDLESHMQDLSLDSESQQGHRERPYVRKNEQYIDNVTNLSPGPNVFNVRSEPRQLPQTNACYTNAEMRNPEYSYSSYQGADYYQNAGRVCNGRYANPPEYFPPPPPQYRFSKPHPPAYGLPYPTSQPSNQYGSNAHYHQPHGLQYAHLRTQQPHYPQQPRYPQQPHMLTPRLVTLVPVVETQYRMPQVVSTNSQHNRMNGQSLDGMKNEVVQQSTTPQSPINLNSPISSTSSSSGRASLFPKKNKRTVQLSVAMQGVKAEEITMVRKRVNQSEITIYVVTIGNKAYALYEEVILKCTSYEQMSTVKMVHKAYSLKEQKITITSEKHPGVFEKLKSVGFSSSLKDVQSNKLHFIELNEVLPTFFILSKRGEAPDSFNLEDI